MRVRHPAPRTEDTARRKLLPIAPVSPATAPSLTLVQDALLPFAPDSAARPSGHRPQHMQGDELMRCLHATVRIMAEGNIPNVSQRKPCWLRFLRPRHGNSNQDSWGSEPRTAVNTPSDDGSRNTRMTTNDVS